MRLRVVVFGLLGALATVVAAVLLFAPALVLSLPSVAALASLAETVNVRQVLLAGSLLVGLYLTIAARSATRSVREGQSGDAFDEATTNPPEAVTTARQRRTAEDLDDAIETAIEGDDDALEAVRTRLRETVTAAYARTTGCSDAVATQAIASGDWTDDRTAAAVLADETGPSHSLWSRLSLWLDPETERRRRLTHAVRAARGLTEGWR